MSATESEDALSRAQTMGSQWYNPLTFLPAFVSMTGLQVRSAGNDSDSNVYSVTGSHGGHRDDKGIQKQSQPRQEDGTISATSTRTSSDEGGDDAFWVQQNFFVENWCMAWSKQGSLQTTPSTWRRSIRPLATDKGCSDEESSSPKLLECRTVRTLSSFRANMNVSRETVLALQLLFEEVDTKHSGTLDKEELLLFLKESAERQNLFVDEIILEMAVNSLVESVGGESDATYITKDEFLKIFEQHPEMLAAFDDQMGQSKRRLPRADSERREEDSDEVWKHATVGWKYRRQYIAWIVVMVGIGLAIGIHASIKWARNEEAIQVFGQCIVVARTCAALLNYLAGLILLPIVAKHTVPFAFFYKYLRWFLPPIEASMDFHILVGIAFAILATTHVLAHICDFSLAVGADAEDLTALFGDQVADLPTSKGGRMKYFLSLRASWTGILMVICLGAAYWAIRGRRTNFNRFWYFHHLLLAMIVLLCLHGTQSLLQHYQTIYWVGIPMLLYMVPRLYREFQCVKSKVVFAQTHGDVVDLRVQKPRFWPRTLHRPGMYACMNVPEISRFEWHPFTISSSPDQDFIGFHIKQSGDWTRKLVELFREDDEMVERSEEGLALTKRSIQIKIQGPLGAPSQDFKNHEVVVLIGAGMGVTPMISVIRSLLVDPGKVKKVFFYWTIRDQLSCFADLMEEIFEKDKEQMIEIRHFVTSIKRDGRDLGSILFHHAADQLHGKTGMNLFLGHRTNFPVAIGRPNWNRELQRAVRITRFLEEKECHTFLCGPQRMADDVKREIVKLSSRNPDVYLSFTKETF